MKIKNHLLAGLAMLFPLALQSCFDNDYDLSDIDTTVRLKATDLVVPINIDVLTLEQVMDIDNDSEIVIDTIPETGERIFAIKKDGFFESENITVRDFIIEKPSINLTEAPIELTSSNLQGGIDGAYILDGKVPPATFSTLTGDIDKSIRTITGLKVETKYFTTLKVSGLNNNLLGNTKLEKLKLKYPAGMVGRYVKDGKTFSLDSEGYLDLSTIEFEFNKDSEVIIVVDVDSIDTTKGNVKFDGDDHKLEFEEEIKIVQGNINLRNVSNTASLPQSIKFTLEPKRDNINVKNFSGQFEYEVEHFSIDPIDLNEIPDFLNQKGTNISIENPQIYFAITNPLNQYNVSYESGIQLTAIDDKKTSVYQPEKEKKGEKSINITSTGNVDKANELMLSPKKPEYYYKGHEDPEHILFPDLKNVLADNDEIPDVIEVDIIEPKMPYQEVNNIELGKDFGSLRGDYTFYAPLELSKGSLIAYTDTLNGWNDEEVDALTFSKIVFNFDATTELPYEVKLKIVPITFDDKDIKGVKSKEVTLSAYAKDQHVELSIEGMEGVVIEHLDGIKIVAHIIAPEDENIDTDTMSPDMKIYIKNSKITMTGYYEKEL